MLTILLINAHAIILISSHTYLPTIERTGYANVEQWSGGTLIYAHNYLSGGEFYEAETITAIYADGSTKDYQVSQSEIVANEDWTNGLIDHSSVDTLTLATCYGAEAVFLVELVEIQTEDR